MKKNIFWGKVLKKGKSCLVRCLNSPFGVCVPQGFERDGDGVYYECVYGTTIIPKLEQHSRAWKWCYKHNVDYIPSLQTLK